MIKLYYDKTSGYLCNRYPKDIEANEDSPYIEVEDDIADETYQCTIGKVWGVKDNKISLLDDLEVQATKDYKVMTINSKIAEYQSYLDKTDYIISKLNELKLEDEDEYNTERQKYVEQLAKRKEARSRINEIEKELEEI